MTRCGVLIGPHLAQHVQAALLHLVDEVYEGAGHAGVLHQQHHLRPPELNVRLPGVQQQQIFSNLKYFSRMIFLFPQNKPDGI